VNISIGLAYLEACLRGIGCVPLHNLMEDAATAEISRVQVWQWVKHRTRLKGGRIVDRRLCESVVRCVLEQQRGLVGPVTYQARKFDAAAKLFADLTFADDLAEFFTLSAYQLVAN
jgi:malate synthase